MSMVNNDYFRGVFAAVFSNGRGRTYFDFASKDLPLDKILVDGFFDHVNKNKGKNPMMTPGDLIEIDAADACARARVMEFDPVTFMGIKVRLMAPPMVYAEDVGIEPWSEDVGEDQPPAATRAAARAQADDAPSQATSTNHGGRKSGRFTRRAA